MSRSCKAWCNTIILNHMIVKSSVSDIMNPKWLIRHLWFIISKRNNALFFSNPIWFKMLVLLHALKLLPPPKGKKVMFIALKNFINLNLYIYY